MSMRSRKVQRPGTTYVNCPFDVTLIQVPESEIPLAEAIKTYIFNGQLVTLPDGNMALVLPKEVSENPRTMDYVNGIVGKGGQISTVFFTDLGESMRNGGGPACLRLRVVLNEEEKAALRGAVILDNAQLSRLEDWVKRNYRDRLCASDIGDPLLLDETRLALDELSNVLCLGSIYDFQSAS
jgi:succinylarginine dihydrolase